MFVCGAFCRLLRQRICCRYWRMLKTPCLPRKKHHIGDNFTILRIVRAQKHMPYEDELPLSHWNASHNAQRARMRCCHYACPQHSMLLWFQWGRNLGAQSAPQQCSFTATCLATCFRATLVLLPTYTGHTSATCLCMKVHAVLTILLPS